MVRWMGLRALLLLAASTAIPACSTFAAEPQPPLVFNAAQSARPGDIVGFQGAYFGDNPSAHLLGSDGAPAVALERINTQGGIWAAFRIPANAQGALTVRLGNAAGMGAAVPLNAATPFHLDTLLLAAGGRFRVFGRNLLLPGATPTVRVDGKPAVVDLQASNEHMLTVTAPLQLAIKPRLEITVDNGNGSGPAMLDRPIASASGSGKDPFTLGVGWADAFTAIAGRPPARTLACNGVDDDSAALQTAIDQTAASGGGVVLLPAGSCRLNRSVQLKSRVVLQGAGKEQTLLLYAANYPLLGRGIRLAGLRDFTLRNTTGTGESALLQNSEQVFFQNVAFEMLGGLQMFLTGNRNLVIDHCDFVQPRNPRDAGPFVLADSAGLAFTRNTILFANGSPDFARVHDAYLADNHITRDVRGNLASRGVIHSMALDFAHRIAVVDNRFDVLGGPVTNKRRNDGETILSEGGGGNRTENIGHVKTASATTLGDPEVTLKMPAFAQGTLPENYGVAIVLGTGQGQARRVVAYGNNTLTVDRAWDVVPDDSSHYATFVWGLEKALIQGNTLQDNPRGIWFYQTAVRDVDIVGNRISEGGGIYLRAAQNLRDRLFTPMLGIRIAGNTIANSSGEWPSYIHLGFVRMDETDFGLGFIGVQVQDNRLQANQPNLSLKEEESGAVEGLIARTRFEGESQGRNRYQPRLLGTIFQNNRCSGCGTEVMVREGTLATVLDGNTVAP